MLTCAQLQQNPEFNPALAKKLEHIRSKWRNIALITCSDVNVPKSYKIALQIPHWKEVMNQEMQAFHEN